MTAPRRRTKASANSHDTARDRSRDCLQFFEAITDLLGDAEVLLLTGNEVFGAESLTGLRLVANCLARAHRLDGDPAPPPDDRLPDRLSRLGQSLGALLERYEPSFVLCSRLAQSGEWRRAWSDGLTLDDAPEELIAFVRTGMDKGVVA